MSVRDNGPGIPEEEIPRVLRSFGQGSLAHQTAEGGTGLGLPITKGLTELHDGTFELKSKLRYGTEVVVTFPRKRVMEALPRAGRAWRARARAPAGPGRRQRVALPLANRPRWSKREFRVGAKDKQDPSNRTGCACSTNFHQTRQNRSRRFAIRSNVPR